MKTINYLASLILCSISSLSQPCLAPWQYRTPVYINNQQTQTLYEQQIAININPAQLILTGKLKNNYADLRILSASGESLPIFIEAIRADSALLWTKVPVLEPGNNTLYLFYGNSLAPEIFNPNNVFLLYDSFDANNINPFLWSISGNGSASIKYGNLRINNLSEECTRLLCIFPFSGALTLEAEFNQISSSPCILALTKESSQGYGISCSSSSFTLVKTNTSTNCMSSSFVFGPGNIPEMPTKASISWIGLGSQEAKVDNILISASDFSFSQANIFPNIAVLNPGSVYINYIRIRKYAKYSVSFDAESTIPAITNLNISSNQPLCRGDALSLSVNIIPGVNYMWYGPAGYEFSGQNPPAIINVQNYHAGIYQVRAFLPFSGCGSVISQHLVSVFQPSNSGIINGSDNLCLENNSGQIFIQNPVGSVLHWESTPTGQSPWSVHNCIEDSISFSNLNQNTSFRALVQNGVCESVYSDSFDVLLHQPPIINSVSGNSIACQDASAQNISADISNGYLSCWLYSTDSINWDTCGILQNPYILEILDSVNWFIALAKNSFCSTVKSNPIKISLRQNPAADFSFSTACDSNPISFTNLSEGIDSLPMTFFWNFADSIYSSLSTPDFSFPNPGEFPVCLTVYDGFCSESITKNVEVNPSPLVNFSVENICLNQTVNLQNFSSCNDSLSFQWFINNQLFSTEISPEPFLSDTGLHDIFLIASTDFCVDSFFSSFAVYPIPQAVITCDTICANTIFSLSSLVEIPNNCVSTYIFGGDTIASENISDILISQSGWQNYSVCLTDNLSCSNTFSDSILIYPVPSAVFSVDSACFGNTFEIMIPTPYLFQDSLTFAWSINQEFVSSDSLPVISAQSLGHNSINLIISNSFSCQDSVVAYAWVSQSPDATFSYTHPCEKSDITFSKTTNSETDSLIYYWDFGEGFISSDSNPSFVFSNYGNYGVSLTLITSKGCHAFSTQLFDVYPLPNTFFSIPEICAGDSILVINSSQIAAPDSIISYFWTLTNGSFSNSFQPNFFFPANGNYGISLTTTSTNNCSSSRSDSVYVNPKPEADFTVSNTCFGEKTAFTNLSTVQPDEFLWYVWDFGDGQGSLSKNPVHNFLHPGNKMTSLKVMTVKGCIDSFQMETILFNQAIAKNYDTIIPNGSLLRLEASDGILWEWSTCDPDFEYSQSSITSNFFEATSFVVEVTDYNGCVFTDSFRIKISGLPYIFIPTYFSPQSSENYWTINYGYPIAPSVLSITNMTGQLVYFTADFTGSWNGQNNAKRLVSSGFYAYQLNIMGNVFSGVLVVEY